MPATRRIASAASSAIGWFFAEKASIDGGTMWTRARSSSGQMKRSRENTQASAAST